MIIRRSRLFRAGVTPAFAFLGICLLPPSASADVIFVYLSPAVLDSVGVGGVSSYDISGLTITDLSDGFSVTGTMSFTVDSGVTTSAGLQIGVTRIFDAPMNSPALLTAHISGTFSASGDLGVTGIFANTILNPTLSGFGPCGAAAGLSGQPETPLTPGAFSASYSGNNINPATPCLAIGGASNVLTQFFGFTAFGTSGTVTVDFGSSVISTGVPDPVPEPSSGVLVAGVLACAAGLRLRRGTSLHS